MIASEYGRDPRPIHTLYSWRAAGAIHPPFSFIENHSTFVPDERILMQRSSRWKYIRKMAWDRDRKARAVCHICGQPIDYSLPPSSGPEAWEPDHVIPVSKRPDLELDLNNILASHTRCNRSRGDGENGENALGMRSRVW